MRTHKAQIVDDSNAMYLLDKVPSCDTAGGMVPLDELFDGEYDNPDEREAARKALWKREFGIEPPEQRPDTEAPPVEEKLISGLLDGVLAEHVAQDVIRNVFVYISWAQAYERAVIQRSIEQDESGPTAGNSA